MKSGGGCVMTIGSMVKTVLTKLDWFSTLFPRIPVPIEKQIHENLKVLCHATFYSVGLLLIK